MKTSGLLVINSSKTYFCSLRFSPPLIFDFVEKRKVLILQDSSQTGKKNVFLHFFLHPFNEAGKK